MEDQDHSTAMYKEWRSIYIALGGSPSSERIKEFIKKHKVPVRRMEKLCSNYNVTLQFLAPYWSPTNPVEFVWARLKQIIRDQNPKLPIEERIEKAWRAIDHEFITACFDRSIRFCLSWEARLRGRHRRAVGDARVWLRLPARAELAARRRPLRVARLRVQRRGRRRPLLRRQGLGLLRGGLRLRWRHPRMGRLHHGRPLRDPKSHGIIARLPGDRGRRLG